MGIPKGSPSNWVPAAKRQRGNGVVTAAMPPTVAELQAEVARLRKELARTEMERDIVRKPVFAQPYFHDERARAA